MNTKIINLLGGPSVGKSTIAMGLGYELKKKGISIELVPEYAKSLVWLDRLNELQKNQLYVFSKQYQWLWRVSGKVEYIITDTSLLLSAIYGKNSEFKNFIPLILEIFNSMNNINFFIEPSQDFKYEQAGRYQTEIEALEIGKNIKKSLNEFNVQYKIIINNENIINEILKDIF